MLSAAALRPLNLPRHRRSPFTAASFRADRGHGERNAAHQSAKEKWDERGEGAKVRGERRVQSAAEPGASKTTSCAQTPKPLGANVSQSVKDAACLLAVSAENVILGALAKHELQGRHNHFCLPSCDGIMFSDNK